MADVKWIKITTDIFDDEKILLIESLPSADSIIVIWFKLLILAGKQNNHGVFMMMDRIPYTEEMLASVCRREINTVRLALKTFEEFGMVELIDGVITISNWNKHQTLDSYEKKKERDRLYQAERRAKQKQLIEKSSDVSCEKSSDTSSKESSDIAVSEKEIDKDNNILCASELHERDPEADFELIYAIYPKKRGKAKAYEFYLGWLKGRFVNKKRVRLTNREMYIAVKKYVRQCEEENRELDYYKNFDTLMNKQILDYVGDEQSG